MAYVILIVNYTKYIKSSICCNSIASNIFQRFNISTNVENRVYTFDSVILCYNISILIYYKANKYL